MARAIPLELEPNNLRLKAGSTEPVRVVVSAKDANLNGDCAVRVTHGKLINSEALVGGKLAVTLMPPKRSGVLAVSVSSEKDGRKTLYRAGLPVDTTPLRFVWELFESLGVALVLVIFIKAFLFQLFFIPSGSMEPTLYEGDRLIATPLPYHLRKPHRGEVVIFRAPPQASPHRNRDEIDLYLFEISLPGFFRKNDYLEFAGRKWWFPYRLKHRVDDYIKRCVAVEGDTVQIKGGFVYVNGKRQNERVMTENGPSKGKTTYVLAERPADTYIRVNGFEITEPVKVPKGYVFVLGDNRNNSHDSHKWGFLKEDLVMQKALFLILPLGRMGRIP